MWYTINVNTAAHRRPPDYPTRILILSERLSRAQPRGSESKDLAALFSTVCALFHFPYALSLLFPTLTKTAGVYPLSSQFGTTFIYLGAPYPPQASGEILRFSLITNHESPVTDSLIFPSSPGHGSAVTDSLFLSPVTNHESRPPWSVTRHYLLCNHPVPHSFAPRDTHNPFAIKRFRTLSHTTGGGGWSYPAPRPVADILAFHQSRITSSAVTASRGGDDFQVGRLARREGNDLRFDHRL
jgi:hypothetical protein